MAYRRAPSYTPIESPRRNRALARMPRPRHYTPIEITGGRHRAAFLGDTESDPEQDGGVTGFFKGAWSGVKSMLSPQVPGGAGAPTQDQTPSWVMPAAILGGGALLFLVLRKKK